MKDIFKGELVRLSAVDPDELGKAYSVWTRDSELTRLMDASAMRLASAKTASSFFEKQLGDVTPMQYYFTIRALDDNRLLGDINLDVVNNWLGRNAFVGLAIGSREHWGKGYGTDAMKVMLRFAFTEINLNRVTLNVFEYNPRAIRSYEKAGFKHEGRLRGALLKDGKRYDMLYMGVLYDDWISSE
ncbi:MAG: GNAT family N-acetyltransferase [Chloroflexi bacterium]|nr:GNAT family N-acetyltransferase [Chloroflexota bacterium]